jgi:prepilin-type N-terminal cleavage/methylation domain-containing protein
MRIYSRIGYTLIEIVVALSLFSVGGLALVGTSAVVGRELIANATRERAGRSAAARLEKLRAACQSASGGREDFGMIHSEWSVGSPDSSRVSLVEAVTYPTKLGKRTDIYRVTVPCPP